MRVIDAKNVEELLKSLAIVPNVIIEKWLNENTVSAIPIEWIEKQIEQYYDDGYNSYGKALNIMLADWRAKNEITSEN